MMKHTPIPYERQEIIRRERELAKYANTMDSLFCIPFTKQGIGVDAILSLIPFVGDIAGLFDDEGFSHGAGVGRAGS